LGEYVQGGGGIILGNIIEEEKGRLPEKIS
jgi:hypothetical protein